MAVRILIPAPLRQFVNNRESVVVKAGTVRELLAMLTTEFESLQNHLFAKNGEMSSFVNIYVNDEDIRGLEKWDTPLGQNDVVRIVPSITGGGGSTEGSPELGLSHDEMLRYSRHLIMPEVAMEGQLKLKSAKVLVVGVGGLGAPLGLYLAAAGVGRLGLVDFDVVDLTNLQRQVTFCTSDVGRPKLEAARTRLEQLNPEIDIITHASRLTSDNAIEILGGYDVIVDGSDNFPTRYLVNDACVLLGKPNVYGSIFGFEGQASVFTVADGPCYRCLYPEPPPPGIIPSCAEGGVLGVLPGIIGSIQAAETIKLILGTGESLGGRLLLLDALQMKFRELRVRRDPVCPVCGSARTIRELIDYEEFCGVTGGDIPPGVPEITPTRLKERIDAGDNVLLLDVRQPHEYQICNLAGLLIPIAEVPSRVHELDTARDIVVYCSSGARSASTVEFLQRAGFERVWNLRGGIFAWADEIDPSIPKY